MNWAKAKNLILICLIILNVFLVSIIYLNGLRYKISRNQVESIQNLLVSNKILLDVPIITTFKPKSQLFSEENVFDEEKYVSLVFPNIDEVTIVPSFNGKTYTTTDEFGNFQELSITPSQFNYVKTEKTKPTIAISEESAKQIANYFIISSGDTFNGFKLDKVRETKEGYTLQFRQMFNGHLIFSNFLILKINSNGIFSINLHQDKLKNFDQTAMDICSNDEALLTFINDVNENQFKYRKSNETIHVTNIDIVYYKISNSQDSTDFIEVPCYRFYIKNLNTPILINAFYNTIIN